jgi:hypothetical protein
MKFFFYKNGCDGIFDDKGKEAAAFIEEKSHRSRSLICENSSKPSYQPMVLYQYFNKYQSPMSQKDKR